MYNLPFYFNYDILCGGDKMKNKIIKLTALFIVVILFCSCGNTKVIKTKDITDIISQASVVTKTDITEIEDYKAFFKEFNSDFTIPGLFEGIIPQGICYIGELDAYAISGYYQDSLYPSMIMLVDAQTGKFQKAFPLQNVEGEDYFGHAGGIASSEDYIYVTSESTCYICKIDTLKALKNNETLKFESNFKLNTFGSFACYNQGVLWCGDFIESSDNGRESSRKITTLTSGETFYAYCEGYILKDGLPDVKKINTEINGYIPDYLLAIPEQVQGMCFTLSGKIIFSTSYGRRNNSKIYVYDDVLLAERVGTYKIEQNEIDILACSSDLLKQTIIAPPMAEGITQGKNGQYIIFESGAEKYRSHRGKYPTDTAFKANIE